MKALADPKDNQDIDLLLKSYSSSSSVRKRKDRRMAGADVISSSDELDTLDLIPPLLELGSSIPNLQKLHYIDINFIPLFFVPLHSAKRNRSLTEWIASASKDQEYVVSGTYIQNYHTILESEGVSNIQCSRL